MTDKSIHNVAAILETHFPGTYLRKNHNALVQSLMMYLAPYQEEKVIAIIKDYAVNYENEPTLPTIVKLLKKSESKVRDRSVQVKSNYLEDNDGCGYKWNPQSKDYECVWKWWWAESKGLNKWDALRNCGVLEE